MKEIKCATFFVFIFFVCTSNSIAQYQIKLTSITNSQTGENILKFGKSINIKISCSVDPPHVLNDGLNDLKNYYLIINGITYPDKKIQDMELISTILKGKDGSKNIYEIVYQTKIPDAYEDQNGKSVLSKFWLQQYRPLYNELELPSSIVSIKPEDQQVSAVTIKLRFYEFWRVAVFIIVFALLFSVTIWLASRDNFTLFRDDSGCTDASKKNPFSLSRVQVYIWTFVIFGLFSYVWSVTDFLPQITAAHLVLLGIAAGQRIISQLIDSSDPPKKNITTKKLTSDGCSVGFFMDLISDKTGLSITRLQYLIATFIFLVVFITNAIQKLELVDFSVEQLALMGTSAGLYLWNKKLDQQ
jgi:hypothetical protein